MLLYESGFYLFLQVVGYCLVCRGKTSEVASSAQELEDGTFASLTYRHNLQEFDIFAVVLVFLQITKNGFLLEDVARRGVDVFCATAYKQKTRTNKYE